MCISDTDDAIWFKVQIEDQCGERHYTKYICILLTRIVNT